jgi:hypothetical protein
MQTLKSLTCDMQGQVKCMLGDIKTETGRVASLTIIPIRRLRIAAETGNFGLGLRNATRVYELLDNDSLPGQFIDAVAGYVEGLMDKLYGNEEAVQAYVSRAMN